MHPDSNATAPSNTSIWCPIYESTRSILELLIKAGGWLVYFAPAVRLTPPSPTWKIQLVAVNVCFELEKAPLNKQYCSVTRAKRCQPTQKPAELLNRAT